jgi:hypothetical protein
MKFNFDWDVVQAGAPYVTISDTGLAFNSPAISLLNNAENVIIGFDESNLTIGVKSYDGITATRKYQFFSRMKNGWIRIGCKDFVKYLSAVSNVKFSPAKKYVASFDKDEQLLYITIKPEKEGINDNKTE